ncbi:hypothetical protein [Gilliamella bombi]|nr:hypothetical protein [Gilliamella bombi]
MGFETWTPPSGWVDVVGRTVAYSQDNLHWNGNTFSNKKIKG